MRDRNHVPNTTSLGIYPMKIFPQTAYLLVQYM